ncbi:hypothetical protein PF005_g21684 [Phytophthora fragariae]|uniref:RxLR effector protein n=1 Tax=Phytophthora fragariae TaxID=53985 RepID=A0A6A3WJ23_9STRA|nr:hypothetical protein PF005_g21684 [Phytophthora fragariae]
MATHGTTPIPWLRLRLALPPLASCLRQQRCLAPPRRLRSRIPRPPYYRRLWNNNGPLQRPLRPPRRRFCAKSRT